MDRLEEQRLQIREMLRQNNIRQQEKWDSCQHMAGCSPLSFSHSLFTAIVWHKLRTETIGICTVCQRRFVESDPDYRYWRQKRSLNRPSESDDGVWKPVAEEEYLDGIKDQFSGFDGVPGSKPKKLDDLTDEEIKTLYHSALDISRLRKYLTKCMTDTN